MMKGETNSVAETTFFSSLLGDERVTNHLLCVIACLFGSVREASEYVEDGVK